MNVSSIAAIIPMPSFPSYSVAKAAQDMLTRSLALEFAPKGPRQLRHRLLCPSRAAAVTEWSHV